MTGTAFILSGKLNGTKARLSGYNTLESFGPVHRWAIGTRKNSTLTLKLRLRMLRKAFGLVILAANAMVMVEGFSGAKTAADQIRKGLAHAMTVDGALPAHIYSRLRLKQSAARVCGRRVFLIT